MDNNLFCDRLVSFMLYVTFHDVFERNDIFIDMFKNESEIQEPVDSGE